MIVGKSEYSDFTKIVTLPVSFLAFKNNCPFFVSTFKVSTREAPSLISKSAVTVLNNAFHPKEFKGTTLTITVDWLSAYSASGSNIILTS